MLQLWWAEICDPPMMSASSDESNRLTIQLFNNLIIVQRRRARFAFDPLRLSRLILRYSANARALKPRLGQLRLHLHLHQLLFCARRVRARPERRVRALERAVQPQRAVVRPPLRGPDALALRGEVVGILRGRADWSIRCASLPTRIRPRSRESWARRRSGSSTARSGGSERPTTLHV
jgi:hypothetical protein